MYNDQNLRKAIATAFLSMILYLHEYDGLTVGWKKTASICWVIKVEGKQHSQYFNKLQKIGHQLRAIRNGFIKILGARTKRGW